MGTIHGFPRSYRLFQTAVFVLATNCAHWAIATDYGAVSASGNWGNALTWTPSSGVPAGADNAYIGSTYPAGSAGTAAVTLGAAQSVNNLYVGYGNASMSGTLNLAGNHLSVNSGFNLGQSGGSAAIVHGGGYFTTPSLNVYSGNSLALVASDAVTSTVTLSNSSHLTTAATANIGQTANVFSGSTLTLGASMALTTNLDLRDNGTTLNMAGYGLSAVNAYVGWFDGQPVSVINRGPVAVGNLNIASGAFNLGASDTVSNLSISTAGSSATAASGNVSSSVLVTNGGALTLGASMGLTSNLDLRDNGTTLNMAGYRVSANTVLFGWFDGQPVTVLNRGQITTPDLEVGRLALNLTSSDVVTTFEVQSGTTSLNSGVTVSSLWLSSSAQATTSTSGNVTSSVRVFGGSFLTLGNSMSLANSFDSRDAGSTFNMAGNRLTANLVMFGWFGGQPTNVLNRGPITTPDLEVGYSSLNLTTSDAVTLFELNGGTTSLNSGVTVSSLWLSSSAQATTSTSGNVTSSVRVFGGSFLTLGNSMSLANSFDSRDAGSTFNMAGNRLTANLVMFGWFGGQPTNVLNRGPITTPDLEVGYSALNLTTSDAVTLFELNGGTTSLSSGVSVSSLWLSSSAQATTSTSGNVTSSVRLFSGSRLTLGSSMTLTSSFDARDNYSTLNMAGNRLTASSVLFGWLDGQPVNVINRGPITTADLEVGYSPFNLIPADAVTTFELNGGTTALNSGVSVTSLYLSGSAQATTSTSGNVTANVRLFSGSLLTLGSSMTLSGGFDERDSGSTLNMAGFPLNAQNIYFGWFDNQPVNVLNRGPITTPNLQVGYIAFNLNASDAVTSFSLEGGTSTLNSTVSSLFLSNSALATTTLAGSVSNTAQVGGGSRLNLGAPASLSSAMDVRDNYSTLNMNGYTVTTPNVYLGWFDSQPVNVVNPGAVVTTNLFVGGGSHVPLAAQSSAVSNSITISSNSVLTLVQSSGQLTGMTFKGSNSSALAINDTSVLQLTCGSNSGPSWLFRWQDPLGGTWEKALTGSIAAGRMAVSSSTGYSIFDDEGYTYVAAPTTLIWNGGGGNNNWSTAANFSGTSASAGHWLRFGPLTSGGHTANNNDLASGSLFYGIFFDSQAPAYNLTGNSIQLSGDVLNQSGTNQAIGLNIQLVPGNGAFNSNIISFDTGSKNITDSGSISGSGMALKKTGTANLILSGTNTYSGGTDVVTGKLIVTSRFGLLDGSNLTVGANAATIFGFPAPVVPGGDQASSRPTPVPEPGTAALLASLIGAAASRYFFRSNRRRQ